MKKFNIKRYANKTDNFLDDRLIVSNQYLVEKKREVVAKLKGFVDQLTKDDDIYVRTEIKQKLNDQINKVNQEIA